MRAPSEQRNFAIYEIRDKTSVDETRVFQFVYKLVKSRTRDIAFA